MWRGLVCLAGLWAVTVMGFELPAGCSYDQECLIEVPGTECADGTPSYVTLTARQGARDLLVFLRPGGACWNGLTCLAGLADPLTRVAPDTDWNHGTGIFDRDDPANPFGRDFNVVTVPYCTGDTFIGNRVNDYGTRKHHLVIHHHGFENGRLSILAASRLFPEARKVVLLGESAGGIGAYYHLGNLANAFPQAEKYVISDSGTPFSAPEVRGDRLADVFARWGVDKTFPVSTGVDASRWASGLMSYYQTKFPDVRFGFLSTYGDQTMTRFARLLGAANVQDAVRDTIIRFADQDLGITSPREKVFYAEGSDHVLTDSPLSGLISDGVSLSSWLSNMVNDSPQWRNVRPDRSGVN